ncbi:helix-turn-helix domain-containing protein [Turicibacter sp. H121]|nr:AraC family transcriptional regulator [Turicibacter sp. H121]MCU7199957.1 AraC family transcriptional regulator [Turicibacter sp. H121]
MGYNNPFAFSKIFRKHKGMSPSQYRNEQQKTS